MRTKSTGGFTLIELLIVIAIIGILAAVLIPNLLQARQTAGTRAADGYARNVYTAAQAYLAEDVAASAAAVAGSCDVSYATPNNAYTADGGTANLLTSCMVNDVSGAVTVTWTYGTGTTMNGQSGSLP